MKSLSLSMVYMLLLLAGCKKTDTVIGLNQNIHHDDFEYSVTSVEKTDMIGKGTDAVSSEGMFVIVNFKVENRALRVNHCWDNSIAYIVTQEGEIYENDTTLQKALNETDPFSWQSGYVTPAGSTETTRLVFTVPSAVDTLYLRVRGSTLMGDVMDSNKFRKKRIRLMEN